MVMRGQVSVQYWVFLMALYSPAGVFSSSASLGHRVELRRDPLIHLYFKRDEPLGAFSLFQGRPEYRTSTHCVPPPTPDLAHQFACLGFRASSVNTDQEFQPGVGRKSRRF